MESNHHSQLVRSTLRLHVVGLCGSRREGSFTKLALQEALAGSRAADGTTELVDLARLNLPPLDPNSPDAGDGPKLRDTITQADAILLATPMYHGSFSGVLKNALDYCGFDEFAGKTVGLLAVSGGPFPTAALDHLRVVSRALNAWVVPTQAAIPHVRSAFDEDELASDELRERLQTLGKDVVEFGAIERERSVLTEGQLG